MLSSPNGLNLERVLFPCFITLVGSIGFKMIIIMMNGSNQIPEILTVLIFVRLG